MLTVLTAAALSVRASPVLLVPVLVVLAGVLIFLPARVFGGGSIRASALLCAALFAAVFAAGCSGFPSQGVAERTGEGETESGAASEEVTMTRAVDGDTVEISPTIDGIEDVRLIGMDTPELSGNCGTEPLAREAEDYTARYTGERVTLEFDEERTDHYGRLLAYAYAPGGGMLNEELVRRGLAQVATFPPNVRYEQDFLEAQERAREEGAGIWGLASERQDLLADRGNGIGGGC